jgi:hypothetical protein
MTLSVHADFDNYADRDDHVEVGRWEYVLDDSSVTRIEYASTERTCLRPMRGWTVASAGRGNSSTHTHHGFCLLDKGHKGRHSTVVFGCDGCGRTLRGEPAVVHNEQGVQFCYLCSRGLWR